jgi:hypothetical protein
LAATAFWGTLLLPFLFALATGLQLTSLWTMPAWTLLPIVLLSSPLLDRPPGCGPHRCDRLRFSIPGARRCARRGHLHASRRRATGALAFFVAREIGRAVVAADQRQPPSPVRRATGSRSTCPADRWSYRRWSGGHLQSWMNALRVALAVRSMPPGALRRPRREPHVRRRASGSRSRSCGVFWGSQAPRRAISSLRFRREAEISPSHDR